MSILLPIILCALSPSSNGVHAWISIFFHVELFSRWSVDFKLALADFEAFVEEIPSAAP